MRIFDAKLAEAVEKGFALQVILADEEGLVLENLGETFSPEVLVGEFLLAEPTIVALKEKLNLDTLSRYTICLEGNDLTVLGTRIHGDGGAQEFLVIVVVPSGNSHRLVSSHVARSFRNYLMKRNMT